MKLEELLTSVPVGQWQAGNQYSLEWYDGPREGVCSLNVPGGEFYFKLLDERYNPNGCDDRLFRLSELPAGSVAELLSVVPVFAGREESAQREADQRLQTILSRRRPTTLVIWTQDMLEFLGCWNIDQAAPDDGDWFAFLGIPPAAPEEE